MTARTLAATIAALLIGFGGLCAVVHLAALGIGLPHP